MRRTVRRVSFWSTTERSVRSERIAAPMGCIPLIGHSPLVMSTRSAQPASSRNRRTWACRSRSRCSSRSRPPARLQQGLGLADRPRRVRERRPRPGLPWWRPAPRPARPPSPGRARGPRRPGRTGRWRRSPAPVSSQQARPAVLFPSGRGPSPRAGSFMQKRASSATTLRSQASASWKPAPMAWPVHLGDGDEPRVAQPGEPALVAVDRVQDLLVGACMSVGDRLLAPHALRG